MRRHAEEQHDQMPGQDSFLDVITNIVGILILLVVIVGVRSSQAKRFAAASADTDDASGEVVIREAYASAKSSERDVSQVDSTRHPYASGNPHSRAGTIGAQHDGCRS